MPICNKPFTAWPLVTDRPAQPSLDDYGGQLHLLLKTPSHPSLGCARLTCTDYINELSCPMTLTPANGEPDSKSESRRKMGSITQLFTSRVTGKPAESVASTQPSVLGFRGSSNCALPSPLKVQLLQTPVYYILPCDFSRAGPQSVNSPSTKLSKTILI